MQNLKTRAARYDHFELREPLEASDFHNLSWELLVILSLSLACKNIANLIG